jgi:hypothetical protein
VERQPGISDLQTDYLYDKRDHMMCQRRQEDSQMIVVPQGVLTSSGEPLLENGQRLGTMDDPAHWSAVLDSIRLPRSHRLL